MKRHDRDFLALTASAAGGGRVHPSRPAAAHHKKRRPFVIVGAGLLALATCGVSGAFGQPLDPDAITKYEMELIKPPVVQPDGKLDGADYYEIKMVPHDQQILPPGDGFGTTEVWAYEAATAVFEDDGTVESDFAFAPGPTIETRTNQRVKVKWMNELGSDHLLPVDTTVHGADGTPEVRTVVHVHGAHVLWESDGYPEAWFTQNFSVKGPYWTQEIYNYPNSQRAATLWYHDHALGSTRLNVYAGLAGFWLIRDPQEDRLGLPSGQYEIPIVIQDRLFDEDGQLYYPDGSEVTDIPEGSEASVIPEFFGNVSVVNGQSWPKLSVEPRKYRLRFLNGSNARFYNMTLEAAEGTTATPPGFFQIGNEGGLLPEPVTFSPGARLLLAPAERADLIVDFSGLSPGDTFILTNDAKTPFKSLNQDGDEVPLPEIMQFEVVEAASNGDDSARPDKLPAIRAIPEQSAMAVRDMTLEEGTDEHGRLMLLFDGVPWAKREEDITETPHVGSVDIWRLINLTEDVHPIHLHLVHFQLLDRQDIETEDYLDALEELRNGEEPPLAEPSEKPVLEEYLVSGTLQPAAGNERGWKETVRAYPGQVTRVIAQFDISGLYVWHCHILEHEDHEMMRQFQVVTGQPQPLPQGDQVNRPQPDQLPPNQPQLNTPQPDQSQPDQMQPDQSQPDQSQPDQSQPDQMQPDQSQPDQSQPDQSQPDQMQPDQMQPDQMQPDQSQPDQAQPDQSQP